MTMIATHLNGAYGSQARRPRPPGSAAATINAIAQGKTRFGTTQGGTPTRLTFSRISEFQGWFRTRSVRS